MEERERVAPGQSIKDYTGTIPLTREEFPSITNEDGTQSNILTEYVTVGNPADPKYLLYPTMRKGADSLIHDFFSKMVGQERKHTPQVEDTIMKIMQDVDSLKMK